MARSAPEILADLKLAFPREPVTSAQFDLWLRQLADVPPAVLEEAVTFLIRTEKYRPTVSAIRARAAEQTLMVPSEAEALAQVGARMRWARLSEAVRGDPPAVHPLVREAVDLVGGWFAFRSTDNAGVTRGQFGRIYRDLRDTHIRETQAGGFPPDPSAKVSC